ncbi:hypothetical protein HJC23_001967 [Cyclotella cryptica]|uniref:Uncharacterized protein n=1 Tax=Cyclotella cryptica TaxID=29204 RepID=A0ABD3PPB6_9STRA|eukprot:CCRYP_012946-RA/>CCRYP_012946-RA protein AED:0.21 eAED:0.21 QI:0/-1/0/1/-1/1/1/0/319
MDADTSFQTPLLVHSLSGTLPELPMHVKHQNNHSLDLQFYDSNVIFDISKEVALGYLVLLTGGEYLSTSKGTKITSPTDTATAENEKASCREQDRAEIHSITKGDPQSINGLPRIDEQTSSLAFAAITDGNVLHTCFGFKSGPNGRPAGEIISKKQPTSIFCCFPSPPASSLKKGRSHKTKKELLKLVEVLREVKGLECQSEKGTQLNVQLVSAYVKFFEAIVKYHDAQASLGHCDAKTNKKSFYCIYPNFLVRLSKVLFSSKKAKILELQNSALSEIENAFASVKANLANELARVEIQTDVVSLAETGITVDECKDNL